MRAWMTVMALVSVAGVGYAQVPALTRAEATVSADRIREQDKFISDDLFEGRYPGLRGGQFAATYIASQFAIDGLKPGGDDGTFLQQVEFTGMKVVPAKTSYTLVPAKGAAISLTYAQDYTVSDTKLGAVADFERDLVFVGYGVVAPEFGWDDYAGVDVKGKVIVCIVGDPPSDDPKFFGGKALTYYGRWTYKFEEAARHGAIGALIIHRTDLASYGWDVVKNSNTSEKTYLRHDANPKLEAASWIQLDVAKKIFAASGVDFDTAFESAGKRGFKAMPLPVKLKAHVESTVREFSSPNVVAILPGANAGGKDQAVMYTAHYDHLGFVPDMPVTPASKSGSPGTPIRDNIYNGAADNGTGVAMLLEMARVWASEFGTQTQSGLQPAHSVIFASVTAEEQGLLGSQYLGQHPPIPASQIALDMNYDEVLPIGVPKEVNVNGAQRTTFYPVVQATAQRFGLALVPDPRPEAGSYYRSDHFSLSRVGIPAFSIEEGDLFEGKDRAYGEEKHKSFNANNYHNFSDNFVPSWDFAGNAKLVRFGMDLGWQVIEAPGTVEWLKGDEFEAARRASEAR